MARAKSTGNGHGLEAAVRDLTLAQATLVQAHASLAKAQADFLASSAETNARWAASNERWAAINDRWLEYTRRSVAIEADMAETKRRTDERIARIEVILNEHGRILQALPDLLREKIGFKPPNT